MDKMPIPQNAEEVPVPQWEPGKILFEVTGREGDVKSIWDKSKPEEVEAAKKQFDYLTKELSKDKRYKAYTVTGKEGERGPEMTEFDPNAERIIFMKPLVGG